MRKFVRSMTRIVRLERSDLIEWKYREVCDRLRENTRISDSLPYESSDESWKCEEVGKVCILLILILLILHLHIFLGFGDILLTKGLPFFGRSIIEWNESFEMIAACDIRARLIVPSCEYPIERLLYFEVIWIWNRIDLSKEEFMIIR